MTTLSHHWIFRRGLAALAVSTLGFCALGQPQLPTDVGTTVNGFQDDFDGTTLHTNWVVAGDNVFSISGGLLHVAPATGDPNHLLYELPGYDNTIQEVLARVRVLSYGAGDLVRGGVGTVVDPASARGVNYLFRENTSDSQSAPHLAFLDDMIAWGPVESFVWQTNTWYWMRLRHEPNAASQGGVNDVFGKIWLGDGTQAEPANWQLTWDYTPANPECTGFAGVTASSGGAFQFDVDYILIKASGLPSILVTPEAFVQTPVTITNQPQSQTVMELSAANFSVTALGNPAPEFQWFSGTNAITGATNATYSLYPATYNDNQAQFHVIVQNVVSNVTYAVTSSVATLTVIADTNPPVLLGARSLGLSEVEVNFSKLMAAVTATNPANYSLASTNGDVAIASATLENAQSNVVLEVGALVDGAIYTLSASNLIDQTSKGNVIASNSQIQFAATAYAPTNIGNATPPGSQVPVGNGIDITGGGTNIGGTGDQLQFGYQSQSGDFDYQVRLDSLGVTSAWTEAGMMARANLTPGAESASVLATPSITGAFFQSRASTNGVSTRTGSFPVNYPNTWLRLKRAGNNFTGFAGFDGRNWTQLGTVSLALPASIYFGFVVSSHDANQTATAAFRDFATVTTAGTNAALNIETLGQSSRRTSLIISEIMYHPTNSVLEFVEIFNSRGEQQDLSGYQLGGSVNYTFPAGTVIPGGGFEVVARSPADLESNYGITGVLGPYTNNLPNNQGMVQLISQAGGILLEVDYGTAPPWPVSPDGAGHSLVLARPSLGENNPMAWAASDSVGGSPGQLDPITPDPLRNVVINEFLAHSDPPLVDFVELYNHSDQSLDVSGCSLSDDPSTNKFFLPPGTIMPARGFLSYDQTQLGFGLSASGETIYFRNAAGTRVLDTVRFEAQQDGVSFGRVPDGAATFRPLASLTPGTTNSGPQPADIVINEIMYDPISLNDDDQYVELYNRGASNVDLGGWQFSAGISYGFPSNTVVQPGGYLVVARNTSRMLANYTNLNAGNLVGNFGGKLAHGGERLALAKPDLLVSTNSSGEVSTKTIYPVENEVTYGTGGRWGQWSHGGGSSLELINPLADNSFAPNWADSDETHKAPWTPISATGTIDNGDVAADELQVLQQGAGECLVDNLQVIDSSGSNRIANSSFESGAGGWTAEGTESQSVLDTSEGYNSSQCFHVVAVDRGDNEVNRVRTPLTTALASGTANVTIRGAVRWLKGQPEMLLRLRGGWLQCMGEMTLPPNPGTPGLPNSRYISNPPPAIVNVRHSPVLPAASQPIVVTAHVSDASGISSFVLKYRLDPSATYATVAMTDDGTGNDAVAGDGTYTGTIPGQASGALVAFYLQATNHLTPPTTATFPNNAPTRECLVRVGEVQPVGNFPVYRIWMTQATYNTWINRSPVNNTPLDITFALGDGRVIYNTLGLYAGSPYISPSYNNPEGNPCGYALTFPADDMFLGEEDLVLDWSGGHGGEPTGIQEQMGYWVADRLNLPWSHRYTIRLHVNGVTDDTRHTAFEAVMQPTGSFLEEWSPNASDGEFFKIERGYEFNDSGSLVGDPEPRLQNFTTIGGAKKQEKYQYNFMYRSADRVSNYTNIFAWVDALNANAPEPYTSATLGLMDIEECMGIFATEHIIVNFDAYGHEIGKNMYAYQPENGKWQIYMFDLDWLMLNAPHYKSSYAASTAPLFNADDPTITRMYALPPFVRAYWRTIQNAVNGPLLASNCNPVLQAKSKSLFDNGMAWSDGQTLVGPGIVETWFSQRLTALQAQLATVSAPFAVSPFVTMSNDVAYVSGTAPVGVGTVWINGAAWPIQWTTVSNWTLAVPLHAGTNQFSITAVDAHGQPIAGDSGNASVTYNAIVPAPVGQVVINEIMYDPQMPDAAFIELYNNSSNTTFDLSGWQAPALSYTFANGASIGPNAFLVLAGNLDAYAGAYSATNIVFDVFSGALQPGQLLTLTQPSGASNSVVAAVQFDRVAPWPTNAAGTGYSLQLIDPRQDNWRVGNWAGAPATPARVNSVAASLTPFPPLWLNEVEPNNLSGLTNSGGQRGPWIELYNPSTNTVSLNGLYLSDNYINFNQWPFLTGAVIRPGQFLVIFADGQTNLSTTNELHTSFTLAALSGSLALSRLDSGYYQVLDYLNYTNLLPDYSYGSFPDGQSFVRQVFAHPTPGGTNDGSSAPAPSFVPYLTAGSVYAQNFDSLPDPGANSVDSGNPVTIAGVTYSLSNPYDFAFPASASGTNGGLGRPALAGWYGLADPTASVGVRFGASDGDQTAGGQISFGPENGSNRALGLLATSTTGYTAFGLRLINGTGQALNYINLQFTAEVWRQSNLAKTVECYYFVDPSGTNSFSTSATAFLPDLNVNFPTVAADIGGDPVDGTATNNQAVLAVVNQPIASWPSDAALWLAWEMVSSAGKSQGLAIDNLSFSATAQASLSTVSMTAQATGADVVLNWPGLIGQMYQVQYKTNLTDTAWLPLNAPTQGMGAGLSVTNNLGAAPQRFYRLAILPPGS